MWAGMHWERHSEEHHARWRRHLLSVIATQLEIQVVRQSEELLKYRI